MSLRFHLVVSDVDLGNEDFMWKRASAKMRDGKVSDVDPGNEDFMCNRVSAKMRDGNVLLRSSEKS